MRGPRKASGAQRGYLLVAALAALLLVPQLRPWTWLIVGLLVVASTAAAVVLRDDRRRARSGNR